MPRTLNSVFATLPAVLFYAGVLPWLSVRLDEWFGLITRFPHWLEIVGLIVGVSGGAIAVWSALMLATVGHGLPNPLMLMPTSRLVTTGPFGYSRNPLMIGGWFFGAGLACVLHSLSMLVLVALIVVGGLIYVRVVEEPGMIARFGETYEEYARHTPRWLVLLLAIVAFAQ
jgi:protein-S-isoprenylcysteine O-methyltransferase Ste14